MTLNSRQYFYLMLNILFMIFIVFSNSCIIGIILRKSDKRCSKNLLFVSLAISDICIGLFVIPNVITLRFTETSFSGILCILCQYFEYMANGASVFTLSAIALGRFRALVFPLKCREFGKKFVCGSFIAVWLMSAVYGIRAPLVLRIGYINITNNNETRLTETCTVPNSHIDLHSSLFIADFVFLFIIPSVLLTVCNMAVVINLHKKQNLTKDTNSSCVKRKMKTVRLLLIMIIIFVVCHFPLYYIRMKVSALEEKIPYQNDVIDVCLILTFLNSFLNFFFYGSLNPVVKQFFNSKLACLRCYQDVPSGSRVAPSGTRN